MKKEWDLLVESQFTQGSDNKLSLNLLNEMIEEVMTVISSRPSPGYALNEDTAVEQRAQTTDNITVIRRPTIKITELWGKTENGDRNLMESLMANIEGGTVQEKIASVNQFMEQQAPEPGEGDISKIMSYLIFLDTFASIVSDYGASVTGFLFEAFLAALMGGTSVQIDDPEQVGAAPGSLPIEDVQLMIRNSEDADAEVVPYSLKVLAKGGQVKGSYKNIVDYFLDPAEGRKTDTIVYLIVIKDSDKDSRDWNGVLKFYEFTITRDNFLQIIGAPKEVDVYDYQPFVVKRKGTRQKVLTKAQVKGMPLYQMPDGSDIEAGEEIPKGTEVLRLAPTGEKESVIKGAAAKLYADPEKYKDIAAQFGGEGDVDRETFALLKGTQGYQKEKQWVVNRGFYEKDFLGQIVLNREILMLKAEEYTQSLNASIVNIFNALGDLTDNINSYFIGGEEGTNRKMIGQEAKQNAEELRKEINIAVKA